MSQCEVAGTDPARVDDDVVEIPAIAPGRLTTHAVTVDDFVPTELDDINFMV